jgi:hypothetical protein
MLNWTHHQGKAIFFLEINPNKSVEGKIKGIKIAICFIQ